MFVYSKGFKCYCDLNFFQKIIFRFKNRKILKQLKILCKTQKSIECMPRLDCSYNDYIKKYFQNSISTLSGED